MEILEKKCLATLQALETLRENIELAQEGKVTKYAKSLNNSVIQCFEYSIEEVWKLIGLLLQESFAFDIGKRRSRDILKASMRFAIISHEEYLALLSCLRDRNQTSHGYNSLIANDILSRIPDHYEIMKIVVERIQMKMAR